MKRLIGLLAVCCTFYTPGFAQHAGALLMPQAKFMTGNNPRWADPAFNDQSWKEIATGKVWQQQGYQYEGYAWYRLHITIPSSLREKAGWKDTLRVYMAHIDDVDETFLNGVKIGQTGSFPTDKEGYETQWSAAREYRLAADNPAIRWDKDNVIAVKVYDGGEPGGIFGGTPFVDMLEKADGIHLAAVLDSLQYQKNTVTVPLALRNLFNTTVSGTLTIQVKDAVQQKTIEQKKVALTIAPFDARQFRFTTPDRSGIELSWSFVQSASGASITGHQIIPYILTPAASPVPHINSAAITGVRPGKPLLFKVAASGKKPLQYSVEKLPAGLSFDAASGIITGVLQDSGLYKLHVTVSNQLGKDQQELTIKVGYQLALTPPMGWNSWNCWGLSVSEEKVKQSAQALIDKGLTDYGWTYMNIDDGWEAPKRATDGRIVTNDKFPDMKRLGDWLHTHGLKFGIYSSPGPFTCGGYLGSYEHEAQDAASYAAWGVDYLKYDWCSYGGIAGNDTSLEAFVKPYRVMQQALLQQPRDILYSLCQYGMKDVWKWGPQVDAQCWRTTGDITDTWQSLYAIGFGQYDLYPYAAPGHWNDPDMMIVGQVGWGENLHATRLTPDEQYTHVSLWCLLSAPLLIGCDISRLDPFTLNLLTNHEVLAVNQDVLGHQAKQVIHNDSCQVWMKELADGSKAIGIFNMTQSYKTLGVSWKALGLQTNGQVHDLWRQEDLGTFASSFSVMVAPHGVSFIRVQ